ncbi:MAG: hypothetical protein ACI845_003347 [Gammaproteobacteria bacterium]|jgi:hypothetical protein
MLKKLSSVLMVSAFVLLYFGLTEPLLTIEGHVEKGDLANFGKDLIVDNPQTPQFVASMAESLVSSLSFEGSVEAYNQTRSIVGTVQALINSQHFFVAFLIALFGIVTPVLKGFVSIAIAVLNDGSTKSILARGNSMMSKWAMADVFAVAIFVAFLAANAIEKEGGLINFDARLGEGFYYFSGYCLISILASQILATTVGQTARSEPNLTS